MPRAESHDAETTVSIIHSETSEIVGYVAKFCEELEADLATVRRWGKEGERQPRGTGSKVPNDAACPGVDTEVRNNGEAVGDREAKGELGGAQSRIDNAEEAAEGRSSENEEPPDDGGLLELEVFFIEELRNAPIASKGYVGKPGAVSSEEKDNGEEQHGEHHSRLTPLVLPNAPRVVSTIGYAAIKQSGQERLRELVEMLRVKDEDTNADVPDLWSCWETRGNGCEDKSLVNFDQEMKTMKWVSSPCGPQRMQCDWCEPLISTKDLLYDESSKLLKKMIRANAHFLLLKKDIVTPNVFDGDWMKSFYDMGLLRSSAEPGGELQQLLLPFDRVRCDDEKIIEAPTRIVSLADTYLRSLHRPDISLTWASMNTPCVWNIAITTDRLADLVVEKLAPQTIAIASSPALCSLQLERTTPDCASDPPSNSPVSDTRLSSLSTQIRSNYRDIVMQTGQPSEMAPNLKVIAEDESLSTDYFLSDRFLKCNWSEPPNEVDGHDAAVKEDAKANGPNVPLKYDQLLQQVARPALWDLMRKKLLQAGGTSFRHALDRISLETLEAISIQQFQKVKKMSLNPSAFSSVDIVEACTSLRQAAWLHTLRVVSIGQMAAAQNGDLTSMILARIISSAKYKLVLGPSNWKDLLALLQAIDGSSVPSEFSITKLATETCEKGSTLQPPPKRQRVLQTEKESMPVRVLCSIEFLEQDELLDELCTEQQISFIERDLPPPIDVLVDERNCICVVTEVTFQGEADMRAFIFSLARVQVQLKKCWLIIALSTSPSAEMKDMMSSFFAALVQFRIKIQVLTSFSNEETGRFVRAVVDECAKVALNEHRILPRLWFERPFLLEEESQYERFLVSTGIINHYEAQSLLHKICMEDLFSKRIDELKLLVQNAVTDEQLELLWRLVHQHHGLNGPMQQQVS